MSRNARGIAQLVVLWALALLGTLALSFAFSMRTEALAARNGLDGARAYFQARTGINRAIAELSSAPLDNVLGMEIAGEDGDAAYSVEVPAERGKIDVNLVPESALKEVLRNAGLDAGQAEAVGDSILAWRDPARTARTHGATDGDYAALPEPVRPRCGKIRSVEELRSVAGVSADFYRGTLAKVFTVDARSPQVDLGLAPVEVLRVLPGFTAGTADELVARRKESPFRAPADLAAFLGERHLASPLFGPGGTVGGASVVTLTSTGTAGDGIVRVVRCAVEVGGAGPAKVKVLRWADHVPAGEEPG